MPVFIVVVVGSSSATYEVRICAGCACGWFVNRTDLIRKVDADQVDPYVNIKHADQVDP